MNIFRESGKDAGMRMRDLFPEQNFFVTLFDDRVYAVGGAVRDLFLERERGDVDLLVVREEIDGVIAKLKRHGKVDVVGKAFGVIRFRYGGREFEIALPRVDVTDPEAKADHKNFLVHADPWLPLEEDLRRRDFVCNSMALNLKEGLLVDPFGGREDIGKRLLRMTDERSFFDDPLRILRGARFAAYLGFKLEKRVYLKAAKTDLTALSAERVSEELYKLLLTAPRPSVGLEAYFHLGVIRQLFPEIDRLTLTLQDQEFHPERDARGNHTVWAHLLETVDNARALAVREEHGLEKSRKLALLLGALLHDLGKGETTRWEFKRGRMTITSNNHDTQGVKLGKGLMDRCRIFAYDGYPLRDRVLQLIGLHHRTFSYWRSRGTLTRKTLAKLYLEMGEDLLLLALLDTADQSARGGGVPPESLSESGQWLLERIRRDNLNRESVKPLVMGRDLLAWDLLPGPNMGKILKALYEHQMEGRFTDRESALLFARDYLRERGILP